MLYTWLYLHTPETYRPYVPRPKVLSAILVAALTWAALAGLEALGVDLRAQVPFIGEILAGKVLTWSQAINTVAPIIAAYLTREAKTVVHEGDPADVEDQIDLTEGEGAEMFDASLARGSRQRPPQ